MRQQSRPIQLENWLGRSVAFVMSAALTVSPPDFLTLGGNSSHNVDSPFCHFGYFFIFNSFDDTVCLNDPQGLVPVHIVNQLLYPCRLFATLMSAMTKSCASIIA
jgi:hypothetical protein